MENLTGMSVDDLAKYWLAIKSAERAAQTERVEVETELIERLGAREEGSQTHDAGPYKITVTGKLTYKADVPELLTLADRLPEHLRPIKTETKLDEAGAKYLRANEPELWRLIAPAITISPAKTGLSIKEP